ncbi:MAG TPA: MFS transporter [Candidatus Bathyarchaeia archaeon]|nr:MFS transporter [Candidatus Bathyarchaeia archaeon]
MDRKAHKRTGLTDPGALMGTPSGSSATVSGLLQFTNRQFAALLTGASAGSLFEYYDFFLAATAAAIVWPKIFFPPRMDPALALAVSISTVGLAYLARPAGAILFGHYADKIGRRNMLVWNLVLMGVASVGTAVLPSYASMGSFALVMLFVFRFLIGVGLGGETGGTLSWVAEARPNSRYRGFWISWPTAVLTLGKLVSIFVFYILAVLVSPAAFLDWGWRIAFYLGAALLVIGIIIRVKILESPMFQQLRAKRAVLKYPAFRVIKEQGRKIFTLLWLNAYTIAIPGFIILPYSVSYLTQIGVNETFATLSVTIGTAVAFFTILLGALISDYVGRLKVLRVGGILTIAAFFPYFWMLNTLNLIWILVAQAILYGIDEIPNGSNCALFTESFATKYRASGAGLTYQLSSFVTGVVIAFVLPSLLLAYGIVGAWQPIIWVSIGMTVMSLAASFFVKETRGVALE